MAAGESGQFGYASERAARPLHACLLRPSALYNLVYVLPMLAIVVVFVVTLGARKLKEDEARILKLLSGLMMLGLGLVLLLAPGALSDPLIALALIVASLAGTALAVAVARRTRRFPRAAR